VPPKIGIPHIGSTPFRTAPHFRQVFALSAFSELQDGHAISDICLGSSFWSHSVSLLPDLPKPLTGNTVEAMSKAIRIIAVKGANCKVLNAR
jgi:hypothetical protein